jgi:hypothetical protein
MTWKRTNLWSPGRTNTISDGVPVQCSTTGVLGFAKPSNQLEEKLAADLAKMVGVLVPEVQIGEVEGLTGLHAVSIAFGKFSLDIDQIRTHHGELYRSPAVRTALARASGLLAFHTWVRTEDLKDDHLLVRENDGGTLDVAGIDFAYSMSWGTHPLMLDVAPGPPALLERLDRAVLAHTVDAIEGLDSAAVEAAFQVLPQDVRRDREDLVSVLIQRAKLVRKCLKDGGY